jgi:hypothetical protein
MIPVALLAPVFILTSCFEEGGYTNVVIPGTVFEVDSLPGDTLYVESTESTKVVPIKTNQRDWTFSVVSGGSFCSAKKSGGIAVSVKENEYISTRTAEITLKGGDVTHRIFVHQKEGSPFFRLSQSMVEFDSIGGVDKVATVTVSSNFAWAQQVTPASSWLGIDIPQSGALVKTLELFCPNANNADTARTAEITFTASDNKYQSIIGAKKIAVTQKGKIVAGQE